MMDPAAAASALAWWTEAGLDTIVDEAPRDWLRAKEPAPAPSPAIDAPEAPAGGEDWPDQLELFQAWLKTSDRLPFAAPSAPRVCPSGDPAAGLMIVTAMPTGEDCAAGTLISGEAGRLFDRMLAAIGRDRESIYLAALSCFPSPAGLAGGAAAKQCATLARHHIGLAAPKAVLLLGDEPAKALTGQSMAQARGRWHEVRTQAGPIKALVTLPPNLLLDQPGLKRLAWADLLMLMDKLEQ